MVPFLGPLDIRCHILIGVQKGTMIKKTTILHISPEDWRPPLKCEPYTLNPI